MAKHQPLGATLDPRGFMQNTSFGRTNVSSPMNSRCSLNCLNIPTEKKRAWLRKKTFFFLPFFFPSYFPDKDFLYPPPLLLVSLTKHMYKNVKLERSLKLGLCGALCKGCMDCDLLNFKFSRVKAKKERDFYDKSVC